MNVPFEINGKKVGPGEPVFIIAEAGSNHNRNLECAHQLIDVAIDAQADAIKFQTFEAKRLYSKKAGCSDYLGVDTPIYEITEAMELPSEWLPELRDHAHEGGLAFLSTPFHEEAVQLLAPVVDAFKIASYELTHEPLLRMVADRRKPILLSTGACDLAEIRWALQILEDAGCTEIALLQCTAAYPTPPDAANVSALVTLREQLGVMTGLSDHTRDPTAAPMVATALGAVAIEKHFTLSNDLDGPDHAYAIEPDELARLVRAVRRAEKVIGNGIKEVQAIEEELRNFARRSIVTIRPVSSGESFSRDNVDILRTGKLRGGLPPSRLGGVLTAVASRDIPAETPLSESDLASTNG